jgi:hypothetical protein
MLLLYTLPCLVLAVPVHVVLERHHQHAEWRSCNHTSLVFLQAVQELLNMHCSAWHLTTCMQAVLQQAL